MTATEYADAFARASIGILGYVMQTGEPNACAVTPYLVGGSPTITSTLAFTAKAAAVRRDPRVVLTAGGWSVRGSASVTVDRTADWFDRNLRQQELAKYPPARSLLSVPGHRRWFDWYVGRIVIDIAVADERPAPGADRVTVTVLDGAGRLATTAVTLDGDLDAGEIEVGPVEDGPAVLLVHEEDDRMADLRQLTRRGTVRDGVLRVVDRRGSLAPTTSGTVGQLRELCRLGRRARANRPQLAGWPAPGT